MKRVRHVSDSAAPRSAGGAARTGPVRRSGQPGVRGGEMTVLHATEPATVYLSLWARVAGLTVADVDRALYDDRTLVKQLAMRRTLFVFPRDLLPAAWGSASARVATMLRARLAKEAVTHGLADDGEAWLDRAMRATLARLEGGEELTATQLREEVPELAGHLELAPGKKCGGRFPIAPRVLTQLAVEAAIVRGRNAGHWRTARPAWTPMRPGWARLRVRRSPARATPSWCGAGCDSFGPGTAEDLQWWLGATKTATVAALADVGAVEVSLDGGAAGWVLPDDLERGRRPPGRGPRCCRCSTHRDGLEGARLLPRRARAVPLRHQRQRRHHRVVGRPGRRLLGAGRRRRRCWCPARAGARPARAALAAEAERLTAWLGGDRVEHRLPFGCDEGRPPMTPARAARAAGAAGAAAPGPLRQARPAPVHQPPRLQPGLRAGGVPGPGADGLLVGLQPAPAHLVRRRGADRLGQRGGVPRDRARRGRRPGRRSTRRSTRRCPTGWTCSRSSSRPAARSPTCSRPATGRWTSPPRRPGEGQRGRGRVPGRAEAVLVERMTKKGLRAFDCRAAVVSLSAASERGDRAAGSTWCCGTRSRRCGPTTYSPGCGASPVWTPGRLRC